MERGVEQTALSELDCRASQCFSDFMARVAEFEELTGTGNKFVRGFQRELATFRRPPVHKTSKLVEEIIKVNNTSRMTAYVEAGCRHAYADVQNTSKLFSCQQELQNLLMRVKLLLDGLEGLADDAIAIMQNANETTSHVFDKHTSDIKPQPTIMNEEDLELLQNQECQFWEEKKPVHVLYERILLQTTLMRIINMMLKLEYEMQEKVVLSLNLNTSLDELESYCLMWELRPFVDDKVVRQCWKLLRISKS